MATKNGKTTQRKTPDVKRADRAVEVKGSAGADEFLKGYIGFNTAVFSDKFVVITFPNGAILAVSHNVVDADGYRVAVDNDGVQNR